MNPTLYALNASVPSAFHDIQAGNNIVPCQPGSPDCPTTGTSQYGYTAGPGYDLVTGLGSVDMNALVTAWTTLAPTSTKLSVSGGGGAEAGTSEGTPLQFTATIGSNATSHAVTGKVTFYFKTVDSSGNPDIGYVLGEVPVTGDVADGGTEEATATLNASAPVGLTGAAQVVAFYGGDTHYLASYSTASSLSTTTTFAVAPSSITLQPHQQTTFSATTVAPPVTWRVLSDSTCNFFGPGCSEIKPLTPTTLGFQAGANHGTVILEALDSDYAETRVTIAVAGTPVDGGELFDAGKKDAGHPTDAARDTGSKVDASPPPVLDAGHDAGVAGDAGKGSDGGSSVRDASKEKDSSEPVEHDAAKADATESSGSSGGCSVAAPGQTRDVGAFGALVLGLASLVASGRRRRP